MRDYNPNERIRQRGAPPEPTCKHQYHRNCPSGCPDASPLLQDDAPPPGHALPAAVVRRVFPLAPIDMTFPQMRRELARCAIVCAWSALRGEFAHVCVHLVRMREIVEEDMGKPFHHGDHWLEVAP